MAAIILPETLLHLRKAKQWSRDQLYRYSGVSEKTIERIEKSKKPYRANAPTPEGLAQAFEVSVEELGKSVPGSETIVADGPFVEISITPWCSTPEAHIEYCQTGILPTEGVLPLAYIPDPNQPGGHIRWECAPGTNFPLPGEPGYNP